MGNEQEPRLVRVNSPEGKEPEEYPIPEGTTRLGRSRGFSICLADTTVSRFHCYFVRTGSVVRVFEGESKHPARVEGETVNGQRLKSGQTLRVGRCDFIYEGPALSPPTGTSSRRDADRSSSRPSARGAATRTSWGPMLGVLALLLVLVGGLLWWGVSSPLLRRSTASLDKVSLRRLDQLQQEIAKLQAAQQLHRTESAGATSSGRGDEHRHKIDALSRRLNELQAELADERTRDREAPTRSAWRQKVTLDAGQKEVDEETAEWERLDREFALLPERSESSPSGSSRTTAETTVVHEVSPRVHRTRGEIKVLVELLCARIDDYGTQLVLPSSLEPDLTRLSHSLGRLAAQGTVKVYEHSRRLLKHTQSSIDFNQRRKDALLKQAKETVGTPPKPDPGKSNKKGYPPKHVGPKVEADQRLLELSEKALKIHAAQREYLLRLKDAVLASVQNLTDLEALEYLRSRFARETDTELCQTMLGAFEAGAFRSAIPTLSHKLRRAADGDFKGAVRKTLTALVGTDLGEGPDAWNEWWASNQAGK